MDTFSTEVFLYILQFLWIEDVNTFISLSIHHWLLISFCHYLIKILWHIFPGQFSQPQRANEPCSNHELIHSFNRFHCSCLHIPNKWYGQYNLLVGHDGIGCLNVNENPFCLVVMKGKRIGKNRNKIITQAAHYMLHIQITQWAQILPECYMNVQFWLEYSGPIMNISAMFIL